jgi:hypothetical protein
MSRCCEVVTVNIYTHFLSYSLHANWTDGEKLGANLLQ